MVIASLRGTVQTKQSQQLVLEVAGVGYLVSVTSDCAHSVSPGDNLLLHTAQIVREDGFFLFGFETAEQLSLFDLLRTVTGVGPKLAMSILSNLSAGQISSAVANEDANVFQSVSGVGAKTAKLIAVTLAGKLQAVAGSDDTTSNIIESLKSLGWSEHQARDVAVEVVKANSGASLGELVRAALVQLGKR